MSSYLFLEISYFETSRVFSRVSLTAAHHLDYGDLSRLADKVAEVIVSDSHFGEYTHNPLCLGIQHVPLQELIPWERKPKNLESCWGWFHFR